MPLVPNVVIRKYGESGAKVNCTVSDDASSSPNTSRRQSALMMILRYKEFIKYNSLNVDTDMSK